MGEGEKPISLQTVLDYFDTSLESMKILQCRVKMIEENANKMNHTLSTLIKCADLVKDNFYECFKYHQSCTKTVTFTIQEDFPSIVQSKERRF